MCNVDIINIKIIKNETLNFVSLEHKLWKGFLYNLDARVSFKMGRQLVNNADNFHASIIGYCFAEGPLLYIKLVTIF